MDSAARVQAVRRFNRFYTKQIGVLQQGWLGSPFTLAEARVLYEVSHHEQLTATDVAKELGLDAGYLSRMLRSLDQRGFVRRTRSNADGRRAHLSLTRAGQAAFARLDFSVDLVPVARDAVLGQRPRKRSTVARPSTDENFVPSAHAATATRRARIAAPTID